MKYKIACGTCGQHLTVSPDLAGSEQDCPTCGAAFIVPDPPEQQLQPPPPPNLSEALLVIQACAAEINALGIPYLVPPGMDADQEEFLADVLDQVVMEM